MRASLISRSHAWIWSRYFPDNKDASFWKVLTWLLKLMNKMGKWDFLWSPSTENSIWPDINYECPQLSTESTYFPAPASWSLLVKRRDKQKMSCCFLLLLHTFQDYAKSSTQIRTHVFFASPLMLLPSSDLNQCSSWCCTSNVVGLMEFCYCCIFEFEGS